jgi:hypothetical protein
MKKIEQSFDAIGVSSSGGGKFSRASLMKLGFLLQEEESSAELL